MKFFPESWVPDPDKKFNQDDQNIINKIIEKLLEEDKNLKLRNNNNFEGSPSRVIRDINQSDYGQQIDVFFSKNEKALHVSFRKFSSYNNKEFHKDDECLSMFNQYLECLHPELLNQPIDRNVLNNIKINKLVGIQIGDYRRGLSGLCVGSVEDNIDRSRNLYNQASKQTDLFVDMIKEKFKID